MTLPPEYLPTEPGDADLHKELHDLRDSTYAHTDKKSGRTTEPMTISIDSASETVTLTWREGWVAFPRELLPAVVSLCERQRDRFRNDAAQIQLILDAAS